mmetsp:Transcript_2234/g.4611  ORF Transcript_2234/g.4611 Transcript_2234/m.4611 type:complete len:285 (-) Transcript_2234:255-1109(-)
MMTTLPSPSMISPPPARKFIATSPRSPREVQLLDALESTSPSTATELTTCPSVTIDIPDIEPHAALLIPKRGITTHQCRVRRVGKTAELYIEDGNVFQLCAARSGKDFIIYTELEQQPSCALARLRSNKDGTFTLVRQRGDRAATEEMMHISHGVHNLDDSAPPINTMTVTLPNIESSARELPAGTLCSSRTLMRPHQLISLLPKWVPDAASWQLSFHGRCTLASSRNFQLKQATTTAATARSRAASKAVLLYGKVEANDFTMDYSSPLSMLQAFAVTLSSWTW